MGIPQMLFSPWVRKHDKPGVPLIPQAPSTIFPQSLADLIEICRTRPPGQRLHAAGSHWALSTAAVSDHTFIETHDPNNILPAMGRTLYDVIPGCLADEFLTVLNEQTNNPTLNVAPPDYFWHFESGKRIFQLYSELDEGDAANPNSLAALMTTKFGNTRFNGSWALSTMGGAGGQTVVGALSTGTHGGDFDRPPIADAVVALHIVVDGGDHYWIEGSHRDKVPFTDAKKLHALFDNVGPTKFHVIYNDEVLSAARIQVGRFGAVYSAVVRVEPQYGLQSELKNTTWEAVKDLIKDPNSSLFTQNFTMASGPAIPQRFLQIAVNPIPTNNGNSHIASITRHWTLPLNSVPPSPGFPPVNWSPLVNPAGRPERVGNRLTVPLTAVDPLINAPLYAQAGVNIAYSPDESGRTSFNLFDAACADANFMDGVVSGVYTEIDNFLSSNSVAIGGGLAAAVASGLGPTILALAPWLLLLLAFLAAFLNSLRNDGSTVGQALNNLRQGLLSSSDPNQRAAGILIWRAIAAKVWESQNAEQSFGAISYAVMDAHNYTDISCAVNVRSTEVFFEATDPRLIAFVDRLLQFEIDQEFQSGFSVAGYISLRFCGQTDASIGQEAFPRTVAVECSGLADEMGSIQFVDFAVTLAQDPNIKGRLHWGQQNSSTQQQIEFRFGDAPGSPTGGLHLWRETLALLTKNGRLDGFSSAFTRHAGLEVVQPVAGIFVVSAPPSGGNPSCTLQWDCTDNPPGTLVAIDVLSPSMVVTPHNGLPLAGSLTFSANAVGTWIAHLRLSLTRNGETRDAAKALSIAGV
jgi:hypothetical protein